MKYIIRPLFTKFQKELLAFANTDYGRDYLSLFGGKELKEKYPIVKVAPDGIHQQLDKNTFRAVFYSRSPYVKHLADVLTSLDALNADMPDVLKSVKPYEREFVIPHFMGETKELEYKLPLIMFDSATYYPDANPESTSVDGYARRAGVNETFATITAGAGTLSGDTDVGSGLVVEASTTSSQFARIQRVIYLFDTSSLGDTATISSAVLSLKGTGKGNGLGGSPEYDIVSSNPASNTAIANSDYSTLGSTSFGSVAYASYSTSAYNDFTLNASGIAAITKTGVSKFGGKINWDTSGSFGGSWASAQECSFSHTLADTADTTSDPKLVITYSGVSESASLSPSTSVSASVSPSVSASVSASVSPSVSPSLSPSTSVSPSVSPSVSSSVSSSISASVSPSTSVSPSVSPSVSSSVSSSVSASISPSTSVSPSVSPSVSASVSPSVSSSVSSSVSPSISPSTSVSSSVSPSVSPSISQSISVSPSVSPSVSASISASVSSSISASVSPSVSSSVSASISPSTSVSPSVSPSASPSTGYTGYTRGNYAALPGNDNDLEVVYSAQDVLDVADDDETRVGQTGLLEYMVHQFKNFVGANTKVTLSCNLQSSLAPSSSTVYLQIYNRDTTTWDEVATNTAAGANTDFNIGGTILDLTNYKDASNVISCRVYQQAT